MNGLPARRRGSDGLRDRIQRIRRVDLEKLAVWMLCTGCFGFARSTRSGGGAQ